MAREQERDPERREAAVRASGEEEEAAGEEGLSDSDEGDGVETGSGREEGEQEAAAGWERSEDARLLRAGLPPAAVPAAAARDPSGRRPPGTPPGRPRMPPPGDQDRARRRSRRRRRDLLLSQLCFLASVALLLWSLSSLREQKGECSPPAPSGRCGSGGRFGLSGLGARRAALGPATPNRHGDTPVSCRAKEEGVWALGLQRWRSDPLDTPRRPLPLAFCPFPTAWLVDSGGGDREEPLHCRGQ